MTFTKTDVYSPDRGFDAQELELTCRPLKGRQFFAPSTDYLDL
jgi:hypothetical protein